MLVTAVCIARELGLQGSLGVEAGAAARGNNIFQYFVSTINKNNYIIKVDWKGVKIDTSKKFKFYLKDIIPQK
mgnify:CR=1 FL=1